MAYFSEKQKQDAWSKAKVVEGYDENKYRQDSAGAWMQRDLYGQEVDYGWEVDHMFPESLGGDKNPANLQSLHWNNNRTKSNDFPDYKTAISSKDNSNINKEESWRFVDSFIRNLKEIYPNNKFLSRILDK